MASTWVLGIIVILFAYLWHKSKRNKNLPPGPRGLPFIGNALQMGTKSHKTVQKWADEYGEILSFNAGVLHMIVISDYNLLKELFSLNEITGKMDVNFLNDMYDDPTKSHGIINQEGEKWEALRRFTLRQLRDCGFGKSRMEDYIIDEVRDTLDWLKSMNGKPIENIKYKLSLAVVSSLWTIISSKRLPHDDPFLSMMANGISDAFQKMSTKGMIVIVIPWLRFVIPDWSGYSNFRRIIKTMREFFTNTVNEHKKTFSSDYSRDFIDSFLKEIEQTEDANSPFYKKQGEKMLIGTIADLFQAGSDTTSITLTWTILYLTQCPHVQEKLQAEIQEIIGNTRLCSISDRPNMPYAEAVISEVLRYSSLVPMGAPHRLSVDKEVRGYTLPKGCLIAPNQYYIHFDPKIWGDPQNFRPERFLDSSNQFKKPLHLIPFSIGKRQCLGEPLARDSLFLFMTNIFQKFTVSTMEPIEMDCGIGIVLQPPPFKTIFKERI